MRTSVDYLIYFLLTFAFQCQRVPHQRCIEFTRSSAACGSGVTSVFFDRVRPREQLNQLTAYLDASQVYGSRADLAISLRNLTNDYGRLREGPAMGHRKPFLPFNRCLYQLLLQPNCQYCCTTTICCWWMFCAFFSWVEEICQLPFVPQWLSHRLSARSNCKQHWVFSGGRFQSQRTCKRTLFRVLYGNIIHIMRICV